MSRYFAFAAALLLSLALMSAPALALTPAEQAYAPPGGTEQAAVQGGSGSTRVGSGGTTQNGSVDPQVAAGTSRPAPNGALPFTGLDVAMLVGVGLLLLVLGIGLARLTRPARSDVGSR
jgi:hypothetical protein